MDSVDKLKKLTNQLPPVPKLVDLYHKDHSGIREYNKEDGVAFGKGLLYKDEIAIQDVYIKEGATFPLHFHEKEIEYIIVYEGEFLLDVEGSNLILSKGDSIKVEKGKQHRTKANKDTKLIAIAIPKIDGFPKV